MNKKYINNELIKEVSQSLARTRPLKKLLSEGVDINHQTTEGYTALMIATLNQQDRIVEYLLKQGANPLLITKDKKIASDLIPTDATIYPVLKNYELLFATINKDLPLITELVNNGALVDFQGLLGYSPLMIAVMQNQFAIAEYLLLHGASLFLTCDQEKNVFELVWSTNIRKLLENIRDIDNAPETIPLLNNKRSINSHHFFHVQQSNNTHKEEINMS